MFSTLSYSPPAEDGLSPAEDLYLSPKFIHVELLVIEKKPK